MYCRFSRSGLISILNVFSWVNARKLKKFSRVEIVAVAVRTTKFTLLKRDLNSPRLPYHYLNGTSFVPGSHLKVNIFSND